MQFHKGGKRLYEWKGLKANDDIPRIAEGKYLKLLYELPGRRGTLDADKKELGLRLCPVCSLKPRCIGADSAGKLTVYCLEGIFGF
jgi:hypothetical protein